MLMVLKRTGFKRTVHEREPLTPPGPSARKGKSMVNIQVQGADWLRTSVSVLGRHFLFTDHAPGKVISLRLHPGAELVVRPAPDDHLPDGCSRTHQPSAQAFAC